MSTISKLPAPSSRPPTLPSNTVTLYRDAAWSGTSYSFNVNDYLKNTRHSLSGTSLQDESTWIAFNLPVGTVVTLMDHWVAPADGNVYNLKDCGRVVDLVGTGQTEGVDLTQCRMNDCISAWFWHTPDLSIGAVELYENANFQANRTVLFLSEWKAGTIHSLDGWCIDDSASSARWGALNEAQTVSLFNGNDGSGSRYENIKAWGSFKELADFKSVGFNDVITSFSWNNLNPQQEIVAPVEFTVPDTGGATLSDYADGVNDSPETQTRTLTISNEDQQTTTVTVTNQYTAGMALTYNISPKNKIGGNETPKWVIQLGFAYTHTDSTEMTKTKTTALSVSQEYKVPPYSSFKATLLAQLGTLPANTTYHTTAERWYDVELSRSTYDPANGLWKRTENVTFQVGGSMASKTTMNFESKPLVDANSNVASN